MVNLKISQLTELTEPSADDLFAVVNDPGGSPVTQKATRANVRKRIVEETAKTSNYTLTTDDEVIKADSTGGGFTVFAPTAVGNKGKEWTVKKVAGSASVLVDADGSETIDGNSTYELVNVNEVVSFVSDGTNLLITGVYTA